MFLGITAITTFCVAPRVRAGGGLPYATASTVSQLIADMNYANNVGGAITIDLASGTTFDLASADNTGNGLPVIGGTKAVALTVIGNGDTIERINVISRKSGNITNPFRLFDVAPGASLTLDHVTLQGGWVYGYGGAILNQGTLNVINGCTLSGNDADQSGDLGGGIYNAGGTVTVSNSTLSGNRSNFGGGIYNAGGTVTVSDITLSDNLASFGGGIFNSGGSVTVSNSALSGNTSGFGGGIYNDSSGMVTVDNSTLTNNDAHFSNYDGFGGDGGALYNRAGTVTVSSSTLSGNLGDLGGSGIYNDSNGATTVENESHITGNLYDDVENLSVLYLDGTSTIGILDGNPATLF
jgi:hypothetical protein